MKLIIITLLFSLSQIALALPTATVLKVKGKVTISGKAVTEGSTISDGGMLKVGKKSYLKIEIKEYGTTLAFTPNTKLKINLKGKKKKKNSSYNLISGAVRWKSTKEVAKNKGFIRSKSAVMGVRGTDFLFVVTPLLGESEIVCFEGQVEFKNRKTKTDTKLIGANQWGGIGGRFGQETGNILTLPKKVVDHFKGLVE